MDTNIAQILLTATRSYTTIKQVGVPAETTDEQLQQLADDMFDKVSPEEYTLEEDFEWRKFGAKAWLDENGEAEMTQHRATLRNGKWTIRPVPGGAA